MGGGLREPATRFGSDHLRLRGGIRSVIEPSWISAAKATLSKRKLKGYYLGVSVDKLDYSDGNLRVRVKIAVFSYPGKDLRGEVPASASLPGSRPGDSSAEDQLMTVVAGRAAELFAQNFR